MTVIPQAAPAERIARFRGEIAAAIDRVVRSDRYILGPAVEEFEAAFAAYLGVEHCVGVGTGTDAIALALRGLGIGPGDEVITTALTAAGTAQAILLCGARPRFVDVDPVTRCIDPDAVEAAITPRTAAIVPVHLFGHPAPILRLMALAERHGLAVVEDCAHAHGAMVEARKLGSFGHAAAFSFYPTKNLGGIGDGGAVVCGDAALGGRIRSLRCYGWDDERVSRQAAGNSRLDEMQAAVLSVLLTHLDEGNAERRALAERYRRCLDGLSVGLPPDDPGAVFHQFAITCDDRERLRRTLQEADIATAVHYCPPLHEHPAFHDAGAPGLPRTEALSRALLSLPIQPEVAAPHFSRIVDGIRRGVLQCQAS